MDSQLTLSRHCYSMRLTRPFISLLRRYPEFPQVVLDPLDAMDVDERVSMTAMLELLRGAIVITGDHDLGLKAAREIQLGDYGALEYAASSAATVREAIEVVIRYQRLINDALSVTVEIENGKAHVCLESAVTLPRESSDFQSAAFYVAIKQRKLIGEEPPIDVWFTHPKPADTREYEITFPNEAVRFDMPWSGFSFDAAALDMKLMTADPKLHTLVRRHAELLLAELPRAQSFTENVRVLLTKELAGGDPSAAHLAKLLHMSSRTLARRLEDEGTSFKELLEDLRRRMSLRYVGGHDLDISEVAFLLGFSDSSSFYRAFKRWTGQTPLAYRKAQRRG